MGDILLQGHLYVTENYITFYSNVLGYVTKVCKTIWGPVCKNILFRLNFRWRAWSVSPRRKLLKSFQMPSLLPRIQRNTTSAPSSPETQPSTSWRRPGRRRWRRTTWLLRMLLMVWTLSLKHPPPVLPHHLNLTGDWPTPTPPDSPPPWHQDNHWCPQTTTTVFLPASSTCLPHSYSYCF